MKISAGAAPAIDRKELDAADFVLAVDDCLDPKLQGKDSLGLGGCALFNSNLFGPENATLSPYEEALVPLRKAGLIPTPTFIYKAEHPIRLLFHLGGSSIKMVIVSQSFWVLMAAHLLLLVLYWQVFNMHSRIDTTNVPHYSWPFLRSTTYTSYLGALVSFCIVFQTTQSYNRFFQQYSACCTILRSAGSFARAARARFEDDAFADVQKVRARLQNLVIAQMYLGFAWLPHYKENNLHLWAFKRVQELKLLTPEEETRLLSLPSRGSMLYPKIQAWIEHALFAEVNKGHISERSVDALALYNQRIIGSFDLIFDLAAMPVPFGFYHLLNVMAIGYLSLLCYVYITTSYYYSLIPFALTALVTLGLRELSNALADPFGCDESDIPILDMVVKAHANSEAFANAPLSNVEVVYGEAASKAVDS